MTVHQAAGFDQSLRKELTTNARAAHKATTRALDAQLQEIRASTKARLAEQKQTCTEEAKAVRKQAEDAYQRAAALSREQRDAERSAQRKVCALDAAAVRLRISERARLAREKRAVERHLSDELKRVRREAKTGARGVQTTEAEQRAREHHATQLAKLAEEADCLEEQINALLKQRAACCQEVEVLKARTAEAHAEAVRLAREERRARNDAKKKQCAMEAKTLRDAQREAARLLQEKKAAERSHKAEVRQIEASTRQNARRAAYQQKRERRIEGLRAAGTRRMTKAQSAENAAYKMAEVIPLGQPILVGHHSERRDRRYREKIDRKLVAASELAKEGKQLLRRADAAERNTAIFSDDPDALSKLRAEIAHLREQQETTKAINRAVRAKDKNKLTELGLTPRIIEQLFTPDFAGRLGIPGYEVTNRAANIRRLEGRLKALEQREREGPPARLQVGPVEVDEEDDRVRVRFPRPDAATLPKVKALLQRLGFKWSPTATAWQRLANPAAWYAAKQLAPQLATLLTKPPKEDLTTRIKAAYNRVTGGQRDHVKLAVLRAELPGESRNLVDDELRAMQRRGEAVLYPIDDPQRITRDDDKAALYVAGERRDLFGLQNSTW